MCLECVGSNNWTKDKLSVWSDLCCISGLFGYARLVPGDNCEMQLKYGAQKWRCKGKIGDTSQSWEPQSFSLKAVINDVFNIRVDIKVTNFLN